MAEMEYRVTRQFKYAGKLLKPGDLWVPQGGKWDDHLKRLKVKLVEVQEEPEAKRGTSKSSRK